MSYPNHGPQGYPPPGQDPYAQQGNAQMGYGQPGYGQPGYGHAGYQPGYPGYAAYGMEKPPRSNPGAGILLLVGGIAGLLVGLLPWSPADDIGVITAFDLFDASSEASQYGGSSSSITLLAVAILAATAGGLIALISSFPMFAARRHGGSASFALIGTILMLGGAALALIASEGNIFESSELVHWLLMLCGVPALIGTILGFAIK